MRTLLQLGQVTRAITAGPQQTRALTAGPHPTWAITVGQHTLKGHGLKDQFLMSKRGRAFYSTGVTEHIAHDKVRARDPGTQSGPAAPPPLPPPEVVAALVSALEVALGRDNVSTGKAVLLQHAQVGTTGSTILCCESTTIWMN